MRKLKLMLSKREWAKRANPCAPWWLFEIYWKFARVRWRLFLSAVSVTRAVYFPVNATYFAAKHLKFDSSYSNYGMRGLSCWYVITRTQLFSFLFPLKPCHANLLNRVDHFLKGLCPDCAHARASSLFSYIDFTRFLSGPHRRRDLLYTFWRIILDFWRSVSSYLKFGSRHEDSSRFCP